MTSLDTEEWKFTGILDFHSKVTGVEDCSHCQGEGSTGGYLGSNSDAEECWRCSGTGKVAKYPKTPKPEVPEALAEHMRNAFKEWMKSQEEPVSTQPVWDSTDLCQKCGHHWLEHDFGVPAPYCP